MAKYSFFSLVIVCLTLSACQTTRQMPIDYLVPAEVSFPSELRRVAIVNNMSETPENKLIKSDSSKKDGEIARDVVYYNGDAKIATESLAESIAQGNYFEEVIICDSALRANDKSARESTLSQEEVKELTTQLNADLLISLENLQLKATKVIQYLRDFRCYYGSIDLQVHPTLKIYLPNRRGPMLTLNPKDSIFWEEYQTEDAYNIHSVKEVSFLHAHLIKEQDMIAEASEFAGTIPVKHLLPYWKSAMRTLYTNGSVDMRDAASYVHRNSWDKALKLWERTFKNSKKDKNKMHAALNIALYYENKDDIEQAITWAKNAQDLAGKMENMDERSKERIDINDIPKFMMTTFYLEELQERKAGLATLNMQMSRFNDDF